MEANSESNVQQASELFQTVLYSGKKDETITQTRCRMYTKQMIKSSANLIPDVSSAMEHLKRAVLRTYIWKQCTDQNITIPAIDERGWKEEGHITPVWFLTSQLPHLYPKVMQTE